jgi:hydrogenase nickel incorporation protein HypA/HybF
MHELSIAMSLVDAVQEEAARRKAQVQSVHVKVGRLSGVVKDALLSSYEMACFETSLQGSRLIIEEVPVVVYCPNCQTNRNVNAEQWFICSECGSPTPEVVQGKELEMVALEICE